MNICLVGPTYPFKGGISQYTTLLFQHLKKTGHKTRFFAFSRQYPKIFFPGDNSPDKSKIKTSGMGILRCIDWANPLTWIKVGLKIRKQKPGITILPWWMWGWVPVYFVILLLVKRKTKIIFICHNVVEHESAKWKRWLSKIVLNFGDEFIVHSKEEGERLRRLIPGSKVKLGFLPINTRINLIYPKIDACRKLKIKNSNNVLFFGYIRKYKGLEYLIKSLPKVVNEVKQLKLYIVGEFWDNKDDYIKLIKKLKLVKYIEIIDRYVSDEEVALYFSACDFVVLPYLNVTGSAVAKTAIALNKPIIATNKGDLIDVVKKNHWGTIVKARSAEAIAVEIIRFYKYRLFKKYSDNINKNKDIYSWKKLINIIEN